MSSSENVYCGFCRLQHRVYSKKHITSINVLLSAAASILLMLAIWQTFEPRVILFFVIGLALSETFVQIRWRLSVACQHCGFDPILYLKDQKQAVKKVKATLDRYRSSGSLMLKKENPLLQLKPIKRKKPRFSEAEKRAALGSPQKPAPQEPAPEPLAEEASIDELVKSLDI